MHTLILSLHLIVCILLIILILLQSGKEGMGVIFGSGNSSVFGSSGAGGLLTKMTTFLAIIFIITALSYNIITTTSNSSQSTILDVKIEDTSKTDASTTQNTPGLEKQHPNNKVKE